MATDRDFESGRISSFQSLVTLTLTAYHHVSLISLYLQTKFHWSKKKPTWTVDGRTYERMYGQIPALLGRLSRGVQLNGNQGITEHYTLPPAQCAAPRICLVSMPRRVASPVTWLRHTPPDVSGIPTAPKISQHSEIWRWKETWSHLPAEGHLNTNSNIMWGQTTQLS